MSRFTSASATALLTLGIAATPAAAQHPTLESKVVISSTRDFTLTLPLPSNGFGLVELYLMDPDGTVVQRLTDNDAMDVFGSLSPDGKGDILFESNRDRAVADPTADLYVTSVRHPERQTKLTLGSSPTWSPNARGIAFHRSASGTGLPVRLDPGAATFDSDIFVARVKDLLKGRPPMNITNNPAAIDDDPDWAPNGKTIVFTSRDATVNIPGNQNNPTMEIYTTRADGRGEPVRLTDNQFEERAPAYSPDGKRILYMCRQPDATPFEICVMHADGSHQTRLTANTLPDLTPTWSPDGRQIMFHRPVPFAGLGSPFQLFVMNADGTDLVQLTNPPVAAYNMFANWGEVRASARASELAEKRN